MSTIVEINGSEEENVSVGVSTPAVDVAVHTDQVIEVVEIIVDEFAAQAAQDAAAAAEAVLEELKNIDVSGKLDKGTYPGTAQSLKEDIDLRLKITDYNDRFKGKFVSEAALVLAHPAANSGDYAIVDLGVAEDSVEWIWDTDTGWIEGGSKRALTTDELIEGSTNLYFKTARVLATVLNGLSFLVGGPIVSTDSVIVAFGKLQRQINDLFIPDTVIRTTEPTRVGNQFTFPVDGYEVLLNKTRRSNVSAFITTIATATDDYKRTDLIYFKPDNTLAKVQGTEDLSLTKIPDVPAGGIGILYINVYGSTIETPTVVKEKLSDFIDDIGAIDLEEVKVIDKSQIVNKLLDVTKKYSIRKNLSLLASESIWMDNSPLIEGMGADFITIETTEPNSKIFTATNCQNFNLKNIALSPKGLGSKAFDLKDGTGMHEFRLVGVNFLAAENAGTIDGFRQWYLTDIGFYNNCKNGFELKGTVNGILFTETNMIGFASTGKLFRQGAGLVINDRAIIQINFSVPTGFVFMDFMPAVFTDNEALQIVDCVAKVNGVKNDSNTATLFPNLSPNNPKCLWSNNAGISNTAIEKIIINPTVASTFVINWLNDSYDITLTANTTFTESNLPASGRRTKTINITIVGNFTPTFPAAWQLNKIGTFKKGELNSITVKFISAGKYAMRIDNSLTVYPKPNLSSLSPNSMLPSTTIQLDIYGSFFTPESFVEIGDLTINNIVFVDSGHLKVFLTSNEIEKPYNVLISNGTTVVYGEAFSVVLGTVYVPEISNFVNGNGLFDKSIGRLTIQTYNLQIANVYLDYIVGSSQNFQVEFSLHNSDLAPNFLGQSRGVYVLEILDKVNNEVLYGMQMYSSNDWKVISNKTGTQFGSFWPITPGLAPGQSAFSPVRRLKFRRINNIMTFLIDNTVAVNFQVSDAGINNNKSLYFRFSSKIIDIKNIKYIELTN